MATHQNRLSADCGGRGLGEPGNQSSRGHQEGRVAPYAYYRWRKEYGGLRVDQAKRLKELEKENTRLEKLVADVSLDNDSLKEAARGNF